jgi:pimeloyl-ACP methyl ester carboxylesterase
MTFNILTVALATTLATMGASFAAPASNGEVQDQAAKPTIVLVHGAFADATGWQHVIPLLEKDGYSVIAVQNPLSSLAEDVATTKRVIEAQKGPVVVVGHSYGGAVITGAAAGSANVKALVYVAAFAPDGGESVGAFSDKYPAAAGKAFVPDAAGFLYIDRAKFHAVFCADVPEGEARIMAAVQKPLASAIFGQFVDSPAWKTIPSWYLVSQEDQTINPEQERFYAKRMGAHTTEIKASHVAFISHPREVADLIEQAAEATKSSTHANK